MNKQIKLIFEIVRLFEPLNTDILIKFIIKRIKQKLRIINLKFDTTYCVSVPFYFSYGGYNLCLEFCK